MARINLLPWREEFRQEKRKEFVTQLIFVCIVAGVLAFGWVRVVDSAIAAQNQRNGILEEKIAVLEERVQEINELKKKREDLVARMKVIQDLQGTRPTIVRYFDETVRAVPDGLFFNKIKREGKVINIEGITESSNRVSAFMRNLDRSDWFSAPNLKSITSKPEFGEQAAEFRLELQAVLPADHNPEET